MGQIAGCKGMPNTNNKIEGVFTDLKKNLNNHSGMGEAGERDSSVGFSWHWRTIKHLSTTRPHPE